jgi:hypothetical protein
VAWTCDDCGRKFGRKNQSHGCAPAGTVDDYFEGRPAVERKIYDRVVEVLEKQGPITIEAVTVGIMIKRTRTFAELRRRRDHMELGLLLSRKVEHAKIKKHIPLSARRCAHMIAIAKVADIDRDVRAWLAEAYLDSPP